MILKVLFFCYLAIVVGVLASAWFCPARDLRPYDYLMCGDKPVKKLYLPYSLKGSDLPAGCYVTLSLTPKEH